MTKRPSDGAGSVDVSVRRVEGSRPSGHGQGIFGDERPRLLFCWPNQFVSAEGVHALPAVSAPLGIASMAAYLRDKRWRGEMAVYDARLSAKFHTQSDGLAMFGDTDEEMSEHIRSFRPHVVAISNMFTVQIEQALRMADIARKAVPNAVIVMGGPHVSSYPLEIASHASVDFAVMGEGEERLYEILCCLDEGREVCIQGVISGPDDMGLLRKNKKVPIGFIEPLDKLRIPAYDMLDMERYFELQSSGYSPRPETGRRSMTVMTSRGCPHQCVFCSIQATMGYKWRHNSPEYVDKHLRHLIDNYGVDFVHFEDDNFTHDPDRFDEILDLLLSLEPRLGWDTTNGVRGDTWDHKRVGRTKDAGCIGLTVAIESGVQEVLDKIVKKRLDLSKVGNLMKACKDHRLPLNAFYIIGFPGEKVSDIQATTEFALDSYEKFGVFPIIHLLTPIPGTELHDIVVDNHLYRGELLNRTNEVVTEDFDPAIVETLHKAFLRRKVLIFVKRTFLSWYDFKANLKRVVRKLRVKHDFTLFRMLKKAFA